ncbi:MAG: isoprenylcysteine carboxylmethyltransferase family protein [Anaerolineae bacterium]|nr:isoprenylcysteine carboxylmethyltransferase family protein [Anaerolineae bacterium]
MDQSMFKIVYGIGFILVFIIRLPYWWLARSTRVVVDRRTVRERILLALLSVGVGALPLVYIFTPWLSFADYQLPSWAGWTGAAIFAIGLWVLWRAHAALGRYWSDSVQLRQGHQLVTSGIYQYIRHPIYTFGWLLSIAQALLLWNWVVAVAGLASFALLYFQRVRHEEQMMLDRFGEAYRAYMNRTGRIVPRWPLETGA